METMLQVRIISREMVKPSSPTPSHLKTLKFSLFDQLNVTKIYFPTIFFYPRNDGLDKLEQISSGLKKSLSEALSRFYPLSGREKDQFCVDCNDEGVPYLEALVDYKLSDFLQPPKIDFLNHLLPCNPGVKIQDRASAPFLAVQLNVFNCGAIAISVCTSHVIADGLSASAFIKSWAAIARGADDQLFRPDFTTASTLFPPIDVESLIGSNRVTLAYNKEASCVTRRFVFDANALASLTAKARSEYVPNPTRYESLSALIWMCLMRSSNLPTGPCFVEHAVDVRRRVGEPLSAYSMGNAVIVASGVYHHHHHHESAAADTDIVRLQELVTIVSQSIEEVNVDFLTSLRGEQGFLSILVYAKGLAEMLQKGEPESYGFTNWCNFGFKEVDFGWGKPVWVSIGGQSWGFTNCVLFKDVDGVGAGAGIEVWVTLEEKQMLVFQNDPQLLAFALPNPPVSFSEPN
ncbi:BAHD acyltransferase At5g47980-like [Corylus avellana]|uniref:BAHD acyltransferase At5g47980-like n=1 Tax=Corylus avellana TaxID=13451 RepID=UPI001E22635C|nr:BAHD acyltransferase At5g47980-like [Corylus avellana]